MAKITLEEQPDFALLPKDSIVHLKVTEVVIREVDGRNGKWEKLEFTFEITGIQVTGDGSPVESYQSVVGSKIWGSVPFRLTDSAENKLRLWSEALLNMPMGVGFELDTDYFVGRTVRGLTGLYPKRAINPATGQPFMGHQIDSLLPMGNAGAQAPQAAPQQQTPAGLPQAQPQAVGAGWGGPQPEDPPF